MKQTSLNSKKMYFCLGVVIILSLLAKKVEYTSQDGRDPFQSPFEMEGGLATTTGRVDVSNLEVQGMVWGSTNPQAIINNTVVKIGEAVDGAQVLDIRKEGVYILYGGKQYILRPTVPAEQREK